MTDAYVRSWHIASFAAMHPVWSARQSRSAAKSRINRAKHLVKHSPALFEMAQRLRSAFR
jgi:hypothetical protein